MIAGMTRRVTVTTGARLHFGPLAVRAERGRTFGGVGMMVDAPGWEVVVARSERDNVHAGRESGRIAELVARYRERCGKPVPPCAVTVRQAAPAHTGLGSGTQLALALGRALAVLSGEPAVDTVELARRTGRGGRSAIGTHGFAHGGFLIDAGQTPSEQGVLGELACRMEIPESWRFVLATPASESGLSGIAEQRAFDVLAPMPVSMTAELCRIVVMDWLPALQSGDCVGFCSALDAFGGLVGHYFRPVQGGVFANRRMGALAELLQAEGIHGIAQTSWGPTVAICYASETSAVALQERVERDGRWRDCTLRIVRPLNVGARVAIEP